MKRIICALILAIMVSGCNNPVAKGIAGKSISGSGTVMYNRVGLDTTTQTPEMASLFVSGDYASLTGGTELFRMEESEDASIFNSNSKTKKRKIFFATGDKERMDAVINAVTSKSSQKQVTGSDEELAEVEKK